MAALVDQSDPFYIYSTNASSLVLVSKPLDGANFLAWRRSMKLALNGRNKFGFADGTILEPDVSDANRLCLWKRNDSIVASWFLNSLSASVIYSSGTATFGTILTSASISWLVRESINFAKPSSIAFNEPISSTSTSLASKVFELNWGKIKAHHTCKCGGVDPLLQSIQEKFVMSFLMGLNESYSHTRG